MKENDIVKKLKEKDEYIFPYSYYSPYKIQKIKRTIEELLVEKALYFWEVKVVVNEKDNNRLDIVIEIKEGEKIKVGEVVFEGETELPESLLRKAIKENVSCISLSNNGKGSGFPQDFYHIDHISAVYSTVYSHNSFIIYYLHNIVGMPTFY